MSSLQDQISHVARQGQDAFAGAVRTWAEQFRMLSGQAGGVPDPTALAAAVDSFFDLAEQVLAAQRAAAKALLQAVAAGVPTATFVVAPPAGATSGGSSTAPGAGRVVDGEVRRH
ncbi:MAG: hypothetical protein M3P93_18175 [Actinomycetota bacterium]|nr:hypothetical protein [Actinomycetota bacterium]